jgi:hypothetical protein
METLGPAIAIILVIGAILAAFQPRAQPTQIIYIPTETSETRGFGCLPLILFGLLAIVVLGLLPLR